MKLRHDDRRPILLGLLLITAAGIFVVVGWWATAWVLGLWGLLVPGLKELWIAFREGFAEMVCEVEDEGETDL